MGCSPRRPRHSTRRSTFSSPAPVRRDRASRPTGASGPCFLPRVRRREPNRAVAVRSSAATRQLTLGEFSAEDAAREVLVLRNERLEIARALAKLPPERLRAARVATLRAVPLEIAPDVR